MMFVIKLFGINHLNLDADLVGDTAMDQRFSDGLIGVWHVGVLADQSNADLAIGIVDRMGNAVPTGQVRARRIINAEMPEHFVIQSLGMIGRWNIIDMPDITRLNDA